MRSRLCAVLLLMIPPAGLATGAAAQPFAHGPKIGPPRAADLDPAGRSDPLAAAVGSSQRPSVDVARDLFRHPAATLRFWRLGPGMTVVDLQPGAGYWTEILAPYLHATGGRYIAAGSPRERAAFLAKFGDPGRYGAVGFAAFGKDAPPFAAPGTVDLVISSREIHNWMQGGYLDRAMAQAFAALKKGGVFGVEEHRGDGSKAPPDGSTGYVRTADVVAAAQRAGFRLEAASEVNANPRDVKSYPFGVWTLPPTRQNTAEGAESGAAAARTLTPAERARYDAIGESDRMTLRFRKPA